MFKKLIVVGAMALAITGCATSTISTSDTRFDVETNKTVTQTETKQVSQRTLKYISRVDLAKTMCESSGNAYKEFLVLSDTNVEFLPIVIQDGKYVQLPDEAKIVFSNTVNRPDASPFNVGNCVEDIMKTGIERVFTSLYKDVFKLGRDLVPYGAGFAIADRFFDFAQDSNDSIAENAGDRLTVTGDNNRVASGADSTFNEQPGIPVEPVTLEDGALSGDDDSCEDQGGTVRPIIPTENNPLEDINGAFDANGDGLVCSIPGGGSIDN